jgi:hypothetical protein
VGSDQYIVAYQTNLILTRNGSQVALQQVLCSICPLGQELLPSLSTMVIARYTPHNNRRACEAACNLIVKITRLLVDLIKFSDDCRYSQRLSLKPLHNTLFLTGLSRLTRIAFGSEYEFHYQPGHTEMSPHIPRHTWHRRHLPAAFTLDTHLQLVDLKYRNWCRSFPLVKFPWAVPGSIEFVSPLCFLLSSLNSYCQKILSIGWKTLETDSK